MARKPGEPLPENVAEVPGLTKSAILLLAVGTKRASEVLKHLGPDQIEDVTRELAALGPVPEGLRTQVIEEFYAVTLGNKFASEGGMEYARQIVKSTLDHREAERILAQIQTTVQRTPFAFLQKAEADNLLTFIQDEHPQTIALIICHLPHHKAAEILVGLPMQKQVEVIKRIATMEQTNPEVVREVERGLESRLANMLTQSMEKTGGVPAVAEILNLADRSSEKAILEGLETEDPELVEEIRRLMFVFEDIKMVDDKGIQAVLREIDNSELALALKTASPELQAKIFNNMSERASALIKEDMEFMGPVRVSDVEGAQQRIVDVVRRLEESGEIIIAGRGGSDDLVV